ncbi:MAG: GH116 family glycosyl hydrolase [Blautia faecis]
MKSNIRLQNGCSVDQLLGQWHADLLHLGEIFEPSKLESSLKSIYKYNFIPNLREHVNPCRIYGLNSEQGTIICSYPPDRAKPKIPVPYAEETMHGYEYQAASHMIMHRHEKEGLTCVAAVRSRYDGKKAQSMERNGMRKQLCPFAVQLRTSSGLQRIYF